MKTKSIPYLLKGLFSIGFLFLLTVSTTAQLESTNKLDFFNQFSTSKSGNSTFTNPYIFRESSGLSGELKVTKKSKAKRLFSTTSLERKAFDLLNDIRAQKGLKRVKWNEQVAKVARIHSQSMAKNKFFSHQGLDGSWVDRRAKRQGVKGWKAISENIAYNRGFANPAEFAVQRWMKSVTHRNNALGKRWEESGIGVAIGKDGKTVYFTQVFLDK